MREYDETSKNKYENKIEKCDQPVPAINSGQCRIGENRIPVCEEKVSFTRPVVDSIGFSILPMDF